MPYIPGASLVLVSQYGVIPLLVALPSQVYSHEISSACFESSSFSSNLQSVTHLELKGDRTSLPLISLP
jgi:hypothetical protein